MSTSITLRGIVIVGMIMSAAALVIHGSIIYKMEVLSTSMDKVNSRISQLESIIKKEANKVLEVGAPNVDKNEFYVFTQELNADEKKVGVPVAVFTLTQIIVHQGDKITIHFVNAAEDEKDRHTFTMQAPYEMNYDLAGGQSTTFNFTANTVGKFTYYCKYDLPSMVGQLVVLP